MSQELSALARIFGATVNDFALLLIMAILIAALLATLKWDRKVVGLFHRAGFWAILGALLLGALSPL